MGGLAIVGAAVVGYLVAHFRAASYFSDQAMFMIAGIGAWPRWASSTTGSRCSGRATSASAEAKKGWIMLGLSAS